MTLPVSIHAAITRHFTAEPSAITPVPGGSHATIMRCTINSEHYLLKWTTSPSTTPTLPDPFAAEAAGLQLLAAAKAVRVPQVHFHFVSPVDKLTCIVMEWIEAASSTTPDAAGMALGVQLALQHQQTAAAYGLDQHNYCGASPQWNGWYESWLLFYRDQRLGAQLRLAITQGRMPPTRRDRLQRLMARLDQWLNDDEPASLLHGDLWGGNWLVAASGEPALIDPAVYYGHREAELAMCHLFGGFPQSFFAAYDEAWPPAAGRTERQPLYQLYHLLNHLNLYGESYGQAVDRILRRYVG